MTPNQSAEGSALRLGVLLLILWCGLATLSAEYCEGRAQLQESCGSLILIKLKIRQQ